MITVAINKICRHKYFNKFYMTDIEKMYNYLEQTILSFKSWFKFLSIYIFIKQQTKFTLLDLNKRMTDFDLSLKEKILLKKNKYSGEYQYPFFKNRPKGFTVGNGLDQNPKVLFPKHSGSIVGENENKIIISINDSPNKVNEKDDLDNSLYLDLFKNFKDSNGKSLNRKKKVYL